MFLRDCAEGFNITGSGSTALSTSRGRRFAKRKQLKTCSSITEAEHVCICAHIYIYKIASVFIDIVIPIACTQVGIDHVLSQIVTFTATIPNLGT